MIEKWKQFYSAAKSEHKRNKTANERDRKKSTNQNNNFGISVCKISLMLEMKMRYLCDLVSQKWARSSRICKWLWVKHVLCEWKTNQRKLFEQRETVRFQRWTCKQQNEINLKLLWLFFFSSCNMNLMKYSIFLTFHDRYGILKIVPQKPIWANNKNDFVQIVSMSIKHFTFTSTFIEVNDVYTWRKRNSAVVVFAVFCTFC